MLFKENFHSVSPSHVLLLASCVLLVSVLSDTSHAVVVRRRLVISPIWISADCVHNSSYGAVNGQWPGPEIRLNQGDRLIAVVVNRLAVPVTIHWHGILQRRSQWYDGVPHVTQCGIPPGGSFVYNFTVPDQSGTFWYHAHSAMLRNTVMGPLVVLPPSPLPADEALPTPFGGEMVLLLGDWFRQSAAQLSSSVASVPFAGFPMPSALHVHGSTLCAAPKVFAVAPGQWYRVRVTNSALLATINFQITGHNLWLYEAEGGLLRRQMYTSLDIGSGQSYSLLVRMRKASGTYWIAALPRADVALSGVFPGLAVLCYVGSNCSSLPPQLPSAPTAPSFSRQQQAGLRSLRPAPGLRATPVQQLLVLALNQNTLPSKRTVYSLNNVTYVPPKVPFLVADYKNLTNAYSQVALPFLPPAGLTASKGGPCLAQSASMAVGFGRMVQVVFQNHAPPGGLHVWHMHGHSFYQVASGAGVFNASNWSNYSYNLVNPPFRNTVTVFDNQWVAVRFIADNPGQWLVHCHLENHADGGMAFVIHVSKPRWYSFPSLPVDYPKYPC